MAGILTLAMSIGLTCYAVFSKTDFTTKGGYLTVFLIVLIVGSIIGAIIRNKWLNLILSIFGVILFGFFLVYDT